jgi:iron complex outermembrane receptor protein
LLTTTILSTAALLPASAQSQPSERRPGAQAAASAPSAAVHQFNIPAQPLTSALAGFTDVTGIQFFFGSGIARDIRSPGASGTLTPEEALRRLLAGTGLTHRFTNANTVTLERLADSGSGALELPPVTVEAQRPVETAWGPVDGFVATRSATATKTDTPLIEIPQSISVITRDQMDARNVQTESEALLYTPGVFAQPFGSSQSPDNNFYRIRGFDSAFGGSYVDGSVSPVNYRFEPYAFERIEVLRGPSSVLYGQGDPGGLVNRVTKRPTADPLYEVELSYGSYDRVQGAFDLGGPIDDNGRVLFRLTGLAREADGAADYDFGQKASDDRRFVAAATTLNLSKDTSLTIQASGLYDNGGLGYVYVTPDYRTTHIRLDQDGTADFDYEQNSIGYAFEHRFDRSVVFRQNLKFSRLDYDYLTLNQDGFLTAGVIPRTSFGFDERRRDLAIDNQLEAKLHTGWSEHVVLLGFDYQRLKDRYVFSFGSAPPLDLSNPDYSQPIPAADPLIGETVKSTNKGLYAQDQIKIDGKWIITLGGRQDWTSDVLTDDLYGGSAKSDNDAFTYRAGLTYLFDNGLAPYVSYAESFLPTGGVGVDGPLKPTTGQQYEVGLKFEPRDFKGNFTAALFDLTKQNVATPAPGVIGLSVQTGEVRSRGLELGATADLTDQLRFYAAYTFTSAEVTESNSGNKGDVPSLTPKHMASAWLDYRFAGGTLSGLRLGGGVRYIGPHYAWEATTDSPERLRNDGYILVDAAIRYDLGKAAPNLEGAEFSLTASNLLDKEYQLCNTTKFCQLGVPRTIIGMVSYRW